MTDSAEQVLDRLGGQLIVSSQVMDPRSPLGRPELLALLAQAAELGGAGGFRVAGPEVVRHLRAVTSLPIIGIVKDRRAGFDNYITISVADVEALVAAGADIIAAQATVGTRPAESFAEIVDAAHRLGRPVMADIATLEEARAAVADGADLVATTMFSYSRETTGGARPPYDLIATLAAELSVPVVAEGGLWTPEHVAQCMAAGASAVVCGSAVTAPDLITKRLVSGLPVRAGVAAGSEVG